MKLPFSKEVAQKMEIGDCLEYKPVFPALSMEPSVWQLLEKGDNAFKFSISYMGISLCVVKISGG